MKCVALLWNMKCAALLWNMKCAALLCLCIAFAQPLHAAQGTTGNAGGKQESKPAGNVGDMFRAIERGDVPLPRGKLPPSLGNVLGDPSGLPGTEITPEDMQKIFPAPLSREARPMELRPGVAPLIPEQPALPMTPSGGGQAAPKRPKPHIPTGPSGSFVKDGPFGAPAPALLMPGGKGLQGEGARVDNPVQGAQSAQAAKKRSLPANPSIEVMVGQMIMAGFTGATLPDNAPVLDMVRRGRLGGLWFVPSASASAAMPHAGKAKGQSAGQAGQAGQNKSSSAAGGNIVSPSQLRVLTATAHKAAAESEFGIPLFMAVEQEGGSVQALSPSRGFEGGAAAAHLGSKGGGNTLGTEVQGRATGLEMAALGLNFNLAPLGDVNRNPLSEDIGRRFRSFGANPSLVALHVQAFGKGLAAASVVPCLRNFPGTGSYVRGLGGMSFGTAGSPDPLAPLPDVASSWHSSEFAPYAAAVKQGWPGAIQPALVFHRGLDGLYPAPLSARMLTDILRGQGGFEGVIVSQDLRKLTPFYTLEEAVLQAVLAGTDILLVSEAQDALAPSSLQGASAGDIMALLRKDTTPRLKEGQVTQGQELYDILLRLVREGRIPVERIRQSWQRIMALKKKFLYSESRAD